MISTLGFVRCIFVVLVFAAHVIVAQDAGASFYFGCRPGYYALTFDDGPYPSTPRLLDILKANGIKATFFVVGKNLKGRENITKRAFDEGHQIASHTFEHKSLSNCTVDEITYQIKQNEILIKNAIGYVPAYVRPPFGECNQACAKTLASLGLFVIQWNIDSDDWRFETDPSKQSDIALNLFKNELEGGTVNNNSNQGWISLQHDTLNYTIDYVEAAIKKIQGMGLKMTTIEQCLANPPSLMYKGGNFSNATAAVVAPTVTSTSSPTRTPTPADSSSQRVVDKTSVSVAQSLYPYIGTVVTFLSVSMVVALFPH